MRHVKAVPELQSELDSGQYCASYCANSARRSTPPALFAVLRALCAAALRGSTASFVIRHYLALPSLAHARIYIFYSLSLSCLQRTK